MQPVKPTLPEECDIVMEGGVTSGVVYPSFVHGLAQRFRLRSIGGASVGAVAAACAAAAQFRRNQGGPGQEDGFGQLKALPDWLAESDNGEHSNLFSLFQPCAGLRAHFNVLQAVLNRRNLVTRLLAFAGALLMQFGAGAFAGVILLLAERYAAHTLPFVSFQPAGAVDAWLAGASLAAALLRVMLAGAAIEFLVTAWLGLRANRCGLCSGLTEQGSRAPGLTDWLHGQVQDMAGLPRDGKPLTFGDLRGSRYPIELAFVTTGLSEFSSHRLPHAGNDLLFRASELRALLPASVADYLVDAAGGRPVRAATMEKMREVDAHADDAALRDLYFLPPQDQWPVLLAARMSLSFPLLLQAVPLYRLRGMQTPGQAGYAAVKRVWFSDGGLTSNFPIHLFDELLPARPTFGIALQSTLPSGAKDEDRVYLPKNNSQGWSPDYAELDDKDGNLSLLSFVAAILQTMRIWKHEALRRTPGFRDRVVVVRHQAQEGGLNLDMPRNVIDAMSASGARAAQVLIERFLHPDPAENGWINHRWVRLRTAASLLQPKLAALPPVWNDPATQPTYQALWQDSVPYVGHAYRLTQPQQVDGEAWWNAVMALPAVSKAGDLTAGAPKPAPVLAISPSQT